MGAQVIPHIIELILIRDQIRIFRRTGPAGKFRIGFPEGNRAEKRNTLGSLRGNLTDRLKIDGRGNRHSHGKHQNYRKNQCYCCSFHRFIPPKRSNSFTDMYTFH